MVGVSDELSLFGRDLMGADQFLVRAVDLQDISYLFNDHLGAVTLVSTHRDTVEIALIGNSIGLSHMISLGLFVLNDQGSIRLQVFFFYVILLLWYLFSEVMGKSVGRSCQPAGSFCIERI